MIDTEALRQELEALGTTEGMRRRAGEAWLQAALLEHASIASFHRFGLQLLRLGAPPDLMTACAEAAGDEVRHARMCFAVAGVYLDDPVGPGPLAVPADAADTSLADVLAETIRDGCVFETLGAAEAELAARGCRVSQVRAMLAAISEDEARHAELAWCFASWALTGEPGLRDVARAAFERARGEHAAPATARPAADADVSELAHHGHLPEAVRASLFAKTLDETILPAARALVPS